MRSRLFNKILNGHPHSIIGKTLLLAVVFCLVLSGTRSFSSKAADFSTSYSYGVVDLSSVPSSFTSDGFDYTDLSFHSVNSSDYIGNSINYQVQSLLADITNYVPGFTLPYSSYTFRSSMSEEIWNYLNSQDLSNPSIYPNVYIISTSNSMSNSMLFITFSKHNYNRVSMSSSDDYITASFAYDPTFIFKKANSSFGYGLTTFPKDINIPFYTSGYSDTTTTSYLGYYDSRLDFDDLNTYFNSWLESDSQYFGFYWNLNTGLNCRYSQDDLASILGNFYVIPLITCYSDFTYNSDFIDLYYITGMSFRYYFMRTNSSYNNELVFKRVSQYTFEYYSGIFSNVTPTPIPSFEAFPTPTAFPTIAINNNLTPIPEDLDPGIIWEDISTDDVAGNLHGVINTITEFISSSVPRFYSEVLTIFYRRSDWFSFLAIIPGLSLIIFLIGRLRRK